MKTVVIVRGLPGSGKSTLTKQLVDDAKKWCSSVASYSTDEYFIHNDVYKFNGRLLVKAHAWNFSRFERAIDNEYGYVVVDNTHTQFWEMVNYISLALHSKYMVRFIEPYTDWKFNLDELVVRNTHQVPRIAIQRMLDRWQDTKDIIHDCVEKFKCDFDLYQDSVYYT